MHADCAVVPDPTANELADIAISSADTTRALLDLEPRVALLSFSTKGSAQHEKVDRVLEALEIVRKRRPDLLIDGELQVDSAIIPAVAARKMKEVGPVAGRANILIFPDLNAGNIGVKLVQIFGQCRVPTGRCCRASPSPSPICRAATRWITSWAQPPMS